MEAQTITYPILRMGKLRLREVKSLAPDHSTKNKDSESLGTHHNKSHLFMEVLVSLSIT